MIDSTCSTSAGMTRQFAHALAVVVRVVELAQHRARLHAAVHVPGTLRFGQVGQEGLAPVLDVVDERLHRVRAEQAGLGQVPGVPIHGQVGIVQRHGWVSVLVIPIW